MLIKRLENDKNDSGFFLFKVTPCQFLLLTPPLPSWLTFICERSLTINDLPKNEKTIHK